MAEEKTKQVHISPKLHNELKRQAKKEKKLLSGYVEDLIILGMNAKKNFINN